MTLAGRILDTGRRRRPTSAWASEWRPGPHPSRWCGEDSGRRTRSRPGKPSENANHGGRWRWAARDQRDHSPDRARPGRAGPGYRLGTMSRRPAAKVPGHCQCAPKRRQISDGGFLLMPADCPGPDEAALGSICIFDVMNRNRPRRSAREHRPRRSL